MPIELDRARHFPKGLTLAIAELAVKIAVGEEKANFAVLDGLI
jgi:hypothetical protein